MPTTLSPTVTSRRQNTVAAGLASKHATWAEWVKSGDWRDVASTATLALPANANEVMVLALDPDVSIAQLVRLTSRDQVLAARMLRLANSAYCAPLEEITTIGDAVVRLGTTSVRNVVLATCIASRLHQGAVYGPQGRALADHSIGVAFLAQAVAKEVGVNPEEAFLYGLVHDIGKLLLLQLSKDFVTAGGRLVQATELAQVMDAHHADLGGHVLQEWHLPAMIQRPVVFHHSPSDCPDYSTEAAVAYVANRLGHRYGFGCKPEVDQELTIDPVFARLKLSEAWLTELDGKASSLLTDAQAAFA
jgi:putative nucleotidyltransferase with HDIG domain